MNNKKNKHGFAMILENTKIFDTEVSSSPVSSSDFKDWVEEGKEEGKLAVDVAQNDTHILVVSTMAGARPDKIEVLVHNDLLTIRGTRYSPLEKDIDIEYYYQECFWGVFSRTIVLPVNVKGDLANAKFQNGVLFVSIPKQKKDNKISIEIIDD
ncbi:MAG: Hsp20/alpha crystallin family protein [Patescibacteria group bacterium]|nr:Hsp20/alpha crystallin family protein [Patescibacteria group bacterium]